MSIIDRTKQVFGDKVVVPVEAASANVIQPTTLETAADLVRLAASNGWKLLTIGSGSKLHWATSSGSSLPPAVAGGTAAPRRDVLFMEMRLCSRVVEYSPEDMTVTVEAGIGLAALADVFGRHRQRVTLDPPYANCATVGGVLAANDSGPIRFAYGTARDAVIGMSMIQPDGTVIKSGGKVVKNVAGYDLHKLYIGSSGAMGPIATVTFRLRPLPESRGAVMLEPVDSVDAERMIAAVLNGPTRPTYIELVNTRMAEALEIESRVSLVIGFDENAEAVAWQCDQVTEALGGDRLTDRYAGQVYDKLREAASLAAPTSFKATMLSSIVAAFVERFSRYPIRFIARAGNGVVFGLLDEPLAESAWREIESAVTAAQGYLQIRGAAPEFLPRSGRPREDAFLSDAICSAFDPQALFRS